MSSPILVTGGTGRLGRHVVPRLLGAGYAVRALSRNPGEPADGVTPMAGDLSTGEGVAEALAGVDVVLHLAGGPKGDGDKARTLVEAAKESGAPHLVYISVVGAERVPVVSRFDRMAFGYFAGKRAAELVIEQSGLPYTTLRATQFHDLVLATVQGMAKLPVVPVPTSRFQPVETEEVAERMVELALGGPAGLVAEMGGPVTYSLRDLVRGYLVATHKHRLTVPVRLPGGAARAVRGGAIVARGDASGKRTWEEFLAARAAS